MSSASSGPVLVAVLLFLCLAAWCFSNRRVDVSLAVLGLYLGLFDGYLKLRTGSPVITLVRDVLVAAIAAGALVRALNARFNLSLPPLGGLVLAFAAVVLVELFNPAGPGLVVGVAGVRQHLEFVPLFFLGYAYMRSDSQIKNLILILVVCAAAGGVVSYIQSRLTPGQLAAWGPGYAERVLGTGPFAGVARVAYDAAGNASVRPFGLGSDLGGGAVAAALALPALIAMIMLAGVRLRLWLIPPAIGIGLAIATSGTRAGIVTSVVSMFAFGFIAAASRNSMRVIGGLAVGAIVVYGAFAYLGSGNSVAQRGRTITPTNLLGTFSHERGSSVGKFGEYASKYPLGLGVGSVGPAAVALSKGPIATTQTLNTETEWNFLVLEVGIAGLAIFVILNLRIMALALTRIRRVPDQAKRLQLAALAAPIFGIAVAGFAGPTTASVPPAPYLWFVAGVMSYWLVTAPRIAAADAPHPLAAGGPRAADHPIRTREPALRVPAADRA